MDWGVTVAGLGLALALLSAWGSAAYAAGRASAAAALQVSEAEARIRGHVDARIEKVLGDRRGEMDKLWERIEHAAESQSQTTAQLAAILATLKHIEGALDRLARQVEARQVETRQAEAQQAARHGDARHAAGGDD